MTERRPAAWFAAVLVMGTVTAATPPASNTGAPRMRYAAVAFDALVLFNPDSVVSVAEREFPGKGRALIDVWRTRPRSRRSAPLSSGASCTRTEDRLQIPKRRIVFAAFGGWDAAGAKSFGYPTVGVNRFSQPAEELGFQPDRTVMDMNGLLDFVLPQRTSGTPRRPEYSPAGR